MQSTGFVGFPKMRYHCRISLCRQSSRMCKQMRFRTVWLTLAGN